jgi:hypothetical protein
MLFFLREKSRKVLLTLCRHHEVGFSTGIMLMFFHFFTPEKPLEILFFWVGIVALIAGYLGKKMNPVRFYFHNWHPPQASS